MNKIPKDNGIHNGEQTHHQDQSIVLVNFKTRKIKNKTVPNPIPLLAFFVSDIIFRFELIIF